MKFLKLLIALMITVSASFHSKPSQAAVGAVLAAPAAVTVGLWMAGSTLAVGVVDVVTGVVVNRRAGYYYWPTGITTLFYGVYVGFSGLIILEEEQSLSYATVDAQDAAKLGLTAEELNSYNSEIDQVNALAAHVDSELAQMNSTKAEDAAQIWLEVKDMVAPETFSAMVKVTSQLQK